MTVSLTRDCREGHHRKCILPASCDCGCHRARATPTLAAARTTPNGDTPTAQFKRIPIDAIADGNNVRLDEGDVATLAESIRKHGVLQPITVVPGGGEHHDYECVFGHRRLKASRAAGLKEIPALVRPRDTTEIRVLTQLAENRERRKMTQLEEALVYDKLRQLGMSQTQIAASVGTQQTQVSQRLILLEYPECVKNAVHRKAIGISDALSVPLELAQATDPRTLAAVCRHGGRYLRQWVRQQLAGTTIKKRVRYESLNVDSDLLDDIRTASEAASTTVVEWIRKAVLAALAEQRKATA